MKKIAKLIIVIITICNCKVQSQTLDISEQGLNDIAGAYYKDTQNLLDPFVGTYIYTNGTTSFKIVLQKKIMSSMNGYYYEDLIIGEYQYIKNGVEKVNTLNKLLINYTNKSKHSIDGNMILTGTELGCDECSISEKRLRIGLTDGASENWAELDIRKININGQPAIKIFIRWMMAVHVEGTPALAKPSFPGGEYVLIKQ